MPFSHLKANNLDELEKDLMQSRTNLSHASTPYDRDQRELSEFMKALLHLGRYLLDAQILLVKEVRKLRDEKDEARA